MKQEDIEQMRTRLINADADYSILKQAFDGLLIDYTAKMKINDRVKYRNHWYLKANLCPPTPK